MSVDGTPTVRSALAEIAERHRFFEQWFNGEADSNALALSLLHFDPAFRRVDPQGRETDRAALEAGLAARFGSRRDDPVRIAVEEPRLLWQGSGAVLAAYVEAQGSARGGVAERRRSTALLLVPGDDGPLLWRHVQETFISSSIQTGGSALSAATRGDGI